MTLRHPPTQRRWVPKNATLHGHLIRLADGLDDDDPVKVPAGLLRHCASVVDKQAEWIDKLLKGEW